MANSKISALTSATTPLAGTETLPVVQSSTTKQVSVANLTAGRAVSALSVTVDTTTLVVDSTNHRVGVGTASPAKLLELSATPPVDGTDPVTLRISSLANSGAWTPRADYARIEFSSADASSSESPDVLLGAFVSEAAGANSGLRIATTSANSTTQKVYVWPTGGMTLGVNPTVDPGVGNLQLDNGNLVQGTAAKGINFTANTPAAGMTSQLLNWYEEGTFTPTIYGSTTAGTATYVAAAGFYTRIGRLVSIQLYVDWNTHTGTGGMNVGGLPFSSASFSAATIGYINAIVLTIGSTPIATFASGGSFIQMRQCPTGGGANTNILIDAAGTLIISGSYRT